MEAVRAIDRDIAICLTPGIWGLRGNCFYADCETDYAHLCDLGAHGIMTNAPARLAAWLRRSADKAGAAMRMG